MQLGVSCHGIGSADVRLIRWCGLSANFESFCADFCVVRLIRRAANIPKITVHLSEKSAISDEAAIEISDLGLGMAK